MAEDWAGAVGVLKGTWRKTAPFTTEVGSTSETRSTVELVDSKDKGCTTSGSADSLLTGNEPVETLIGTNEPSGVKRTSRLGELGRVVTTGGDGLTWI